MNVASSVALATEPVTSKGIVAAGAYVEGRRVANIAIDEAAAWRSRPDHVVWIGLHEPDKALLASVQRQFDLHDQPVSPEREKVRNESSSHGERAALVAFQRDLLG